MTKAKLYSMEQVQAAQKMLRGLTAKRSGKTKKEVVEFLAEDVRKAVKEGHSLKAIQDMLRQSDIPVSQARMKALLGETTKDSPQNGPVAPEEIDTPSAPQKKSAISSNDGSTEASL